MIKSVRKSNFIPVSVLRPICLTTSLTNSLPLIRHHFSTTTNGSKNDKKNSDKKNSKVDALKDDTINDKTNDHIVISNEDELAKVVIDIFDSHKFESLNKLLINLQRNSEINTRKSLLAQERRSGIRKEYMWFYNLLWSATVDESAKLFPITVERYKSPDQQAVFARLMLMARATCLNVDVQNLPDGDEQLVNSLAAEMCTILPSHVISTLVADLDLFQTDKSITTKRLVHGLQLQLNSSSTGLSMLRQALAQPVRDSKASNNSHSISASDLADRFKAFFGSKTLTSPSTPIAAPSSSTKVDLPVKSTVEKVKTVPTSPSSFASNRAYMLSLFCHAVGERPNHSFENEVAQKSQQVKSYAQLMEEGQDADASLLRPYEERIASSTQLDSGISTNTGDSIIDDSLKFMLLHVPDGTDEATLCAAFKNIGKVAKVMLFVEPISVEETASRNVTKTKPVLAQGDPIDSELSKKFLHVKRDKVGAVKPFPVKGRVEKVSCQIIRKPIIGMYYF